MSITINDFLEIYGAQLNNNVEEYCLKPLYDPKQEDEIDNDNRSNLKQLLREPKSGQFLPILAGQKALLKDNLLLIGEMGFGKTMTALSISKVLLKNKSRVLIMCPGHLVQKWIREIKITIPHAIIFNMNNPGLSEMNDLYGKPKGREFWIIGKERAKNHFFKKPGYLIRNKAIYCPKCMTQIFNIPDLDAKCTVCHEPLWQADGSRTKRYAKSEYIKRKFAKPFDLFIADEFHLYKAGDSAQGKAFANFVCSSKRTIGLSGTLMGGYASNLFYLLFRLFPQKMSQSFNYNDLTKFINRYGVLETIEKESKKSVGSASIQKRVKQKSKERPGISPLIFSELLLEKCIFVRLSDMGSIDMPKYTEHIVQVEMTPEQAKEYSILELDLRLAAAKALAFNSKKYLGALVQSLIAYPDGTRQGEVVYDPAQVENNEVEGLKPIAQAGALDIEILPKEQELLNLVSQSKQGGGKTLVLLEHTGKRNLIPELSKRLEDKGFKTVSLYSDTCKADQREKWIKDNATDNDVLICNPRLIETGLDLLEYTNIIFFQTGYNPFTVRQACRRSYRVNQTKDINVYFMCYKNTMQASAMNLISEKTQVSLACEGELSNIGLTELANNNTSMLIQLAKSLVNNDDTKIVKQTEIKTQINDDVQHDTLNINNDTTKIVKQTEIKTQINDDVQHDKQKIDEIVQKYDRIKRGAIEHKDGYGIFILDNGQYLKFFKGNVYYNDLKCGCYDKSGKGKISNKMIEIHSPSKNIFELIEIRATH